MESRFVWWSFLTAALLGTTTVAQATNGYSPTGFGTANKGLGGAGVALPQDALLDPRLSVGRQLRFFARLQGMAISEARNDVQRVLQTVDLLDAINAKPSDLSHGMRKRIAIAQALLGSPKLVLLDEPTAGIDPPNAKMIRDLIRQQSEETTFIVSSHNLDELERLCALVVYLEKGRLISVGPVVDDEAQNFITLRLATVPEGEFLEAASSLAGIQHVSRSAQGDYLIQTDDDMRSSLALMQLLADKGWRYRQMSSGKSLEERLYGKAPKR